MVISWNIGRGRGVQPKIPKQWCFYKRDFFPINQWLKYRVPYWRSLYHPYDPCVVYMVTFAVYWWYMLPYIAYIRILWVIVAPSFWARSNILARTESIALAALPQLTWFQVLAFLVVASGVLQVVLHVLTYFSPIPRAYEKHPRSTKPWCFLDREFPHDWDILGRFRGCLGLG